LWKDKIVGLAALFTLLVCGSGWDFTTKHGINVILGQKNRPSIEEVEEWTNWAIGFWSERKPEWRTCAMDSVKDLQARFVDKHVIYLPDGVKALAYMWYKEVEVGRGHPDAPLDSCQVSRLYIHEVHHVVIWWCSGEMDNDTSHRFMEALGAEGGPCPWK